VLPPDGSAHRDGSASGPASVVSDPLLTPAPSPAPRWSRDTGALPPLGGRRRHRAPDPGRSSASSWSAVTALALHSPSIPSSSCPSWSHAAAAEANEAAPVAGHRLVAGLAMPDPAG